MIVGIVTPFVYPHDREIRVRKLASAFKHNGYEVHVFCASDNSKLFEFVDRDGITINRINFLGKLGQVPFPFNPIWYFWLAWMCKKLSIDILVARDLRLSLPSAIIGRLLGIKTITDLGENFPAMYRFLGRSRYFINFAKLLEKSICKISNVVVVVAGENKERLINEYKISAQKIQVVTNVPSINQLPRWGEVIPKETFLSSEERLKLVFIGLIDDFRGLELLLHALTFLDNIAYKLTIIGDGPNLSQIMEMSKKMKLDKNVDFQGWVSEGKYQALMEHHIGLIPHVDCELTQTTIPNKLFDYMSVGLPVLATDLQPIKRIIHECNCGWIVPRDPIPISQMLKKLAFSPLDLYRAGQNGHDAIAVKYNWEVQTGELFSTIGVDPRLGKW